MEERRQHRNAKQWRSVAAAKEEEERLKGSMGTGLPVLGNKLTTQFPAYSLMQPVTSQLTA